MILTALAAVLAFVPLNRGTVLTPVFLPALYAIGFRIRPRSGQALPVEPASAVRLPERARGLFKGIAGRFRGMAVHGAMQRSLWSR